MIRYVVLLCLMLYAAGAPSLEFMRPTAFDQPLSTIHEEVNSGVKDHIVKPTQYAWGEFRYELSVMMNGTHSPRSTMIAEGEAEVDTMPIAAHVQPVGSF